jgi:hypothetical protein
MRWNLCGRRRLGGSRPVAPWSPWRSWYVPSLEWLESRVLPSLLSTFELDGNATTGVLGTSGSTTTSHDWARSSPTLGRRRRAPAVGPLPTVRPASRWQAVSSTTRSTPKATTPSPAARRTPTASNRGTGPPTPRIRHQRTSRTSSPPPTWTRTRPVPRSGMCSSTPA